VFIGKMDLPRPIYLDGMRIRNIKLAFTYIFSGHSHPEIEMGRLTSISFMGDMWKGVGGLKI